MDSNVNLINSTTASLDQEIFLRSVPTNVNLKELSLDSLRLLVYYISKSGPFDLAVANGFEGTLEDWLLSLRANLTLKTSVPLYTDLSSLSSLDEGDLVYVSETNLVYLYSNNTFPTKENGISLVGASAYEVALQAGFKGTREDWLLTLKGDSFKFDDFTSEEIELLQGATGKSIYDIAVEQGFQGSEKAFLESLKGDKGDSGEDGSKGETGDRGSSAYQLAVQQGFVGTVEEWLESLVGAKGNTGLSHFEEAVERGYTGNFEEWSNSFKGESAYSIAVSQGFKGSLTEWLDSLQGDSAYEDALEQGFEGTVQEWLSSLVGKSAYQSALNKGFKGTEKEWLQSLEGKDAYTLAVDNGFVGSKAKWLQSLKAQSPYEIAVEYGFKGTEKQWINSLRGASAYQVAVDHGFKGTPIDWFKTLEGPSAYSIAVQQGFEGTLKEWLDSLQGAKGDSAYQVAVKNGFNGTVTDWFSSLKGTTGDSAYQIAVKQGYVGSIVKWYQDILALKNYSEKAKEYSDAVTKVTETFLKELEEYVDISAKLEELLLKNNQLNLSFKTLKETTEKSSQVSSEEVLSFKKSLLEFQSDLEIIKNTYKQYSDLSLKKDSYILSFDGKTLENFNKELLSKVTVLEGLLSSFVKSENYIAEIENLHSIIELQNNALADVRTSVKKDSEVSTYLGNTQQDFNKNILQITKGYSTALSLQEDALEATRSLLNSIAIKNGNGVKNFTKEVDLLKYIPKDTDPLFAYAFDTSTSYAYQGSTWVLLGKSDLELSKEYVNKNSLFNPIRLSTSTVPLDLNTVEETSYIYVATFQALDVTSNAPERTPFLFKSDKVHVDGLTVPQIVITKTGSFYYRVCTKDTASSPLVAPSWKKLEDSSSILSYNFKKAEDVSGVVDSTGRLTPAIITELGLTSWKDLKINNTYNITSSTTATEWGLPENRGGTLTFHKDGTTTITGRATWIPNQSSRLYISTYNGSSWTAWSSTASSADLITKQDAQELLTTALDLNNELQTRRFRVSSTSVAQAMTNAPFVVAGEFEITRLSEYTVLQKAISREGAYYSRTGSRSNLTTDFSFPSTWRKYATISEVETLISQKQGESSGGSSLDKSVDNSVIGIGSSSMHRYNTQMQIEMNNRGRIYINAGFGGTGLATAAMFCGQGKYFMNFDNTTLKAGVKTPFTWSGGGFGTTTDLPTGDDYRDWTIILENGVRGKIYFGSKQFEPVAGTEETPVNGAVEVYPNFARYKRAINILNTGKNSFGDGSAVRIAAVKESFDETVRQLKEAQPDARFIVLGHHVNTGSNSTVTKAVQEVNSYLKNKYGNRFVDLDAWVVSQKLWEDLNISPTTQDLSEQSAGHIPLSLTENLDKTHMNPTMAKYVVVNFIIPKLEHLGYLS